MKAALFILGVVFMTAAGFQAANGYYGPAGVTACLALALLGLWALRNMMMAHHTVSRILQEECRATCLGGCIHGECIREGKRQ